MHPCPALFCLGNLLKSSFEWFVGRFPGSPTAVPHGDQREARDALYTAFADVARALGHGRRVEIVDVLAHGERSVEEVAAELDQSLANTSHHLRALARTGLVRANRHGTHVVYRLASRRVADLWYLVRDVAAEHVAEVDRLATSYLGDRSEVPQMGRRQVAERLGDPALVVLDARPAVEHRAGRVPGARLVAVDAGDERLVDLSAAADVVVYSRGPYCPRADIVVRRLRHAGLPAHRLEDGFAEWRDAGLPVDDG